MPYKPLRPCRYPRCPQLTSDRYCQQHAKQIEAELRERKGAASERGYNYQWRLVPRLVLSNQGHCDQVERRHEGAAHFVAWIELPVQRFYAGIQFIRDGQAESVL